MWENGWTDTAYETATCHNPRLHNFTGDRKNLTAPQQTNT
jgi:hypothetical protein